MLTSNKRTWVPLTCLVACAGLATTAFAGEPRASNAEATPGAELQPAEDIQVVYLIKLLESSKQFRVRAQAAISLGVMDKSLAARDALTAALQDEHPAVRAAAATSLGRIGAVHHVIQLRTLAGDPEQPVRKAALASISRLETELANSLIVLETAATATARSAANRM